MERRYSKQREAVMTAVRSTKCHPDAEWVYREVRKEIPNVSLGTVYRNLGELVKTRELIEIDTGDSRVRFDADTAPHQHFVCSECGGVSDLYFTSNIGEQAEQLGYSVTGENVVVYGICPDCRIKS